MNSYRRRDRAILKREFKSKSKTQKGRLSGRVEPTSESFRWEFVDVSERKGGAADWLTETGFAKFCIDEREIVSTLRDKIESRSSHKAEAIEELLGGLAKPK